jgi:tRNA (guanine37-N1)-methyltransferase
LKDLIIPSPCQFYGYNKGIKTVLEKTEKIKGRLRKFTTKYLAGENTKEVLYRENNCIFRFNIDETYFSPRLSNERKEIALKIKKNETVLVMFAGVAPYPIVIAKNSMAKKVFSNEINRGANKYAELNIKLNKVNDKVELLLGDIKRIAPKLKQKFEVIVMPRPQLKETFLKEAFQLSKKGTRIYYYGFCRTEDTKKMVEKIKEEAKKARKKIKILRIKKAGEIAPYKIRLRVDFKVL